jgi:hypothetical protein
MAETNTQDQELNKETALEQATETEGQPLAAVLMGAPTVEDVNTTQVFKSQPVRLEPLPVLKTAPRANPNPYTGLPVRRKGHVQTTPYE